MNKYISELASEGNTAEEAKLKSYHENLHYVFTEYQGSNITHWNFGNTQDAESTQTPAKKLTRNILLIADADIEDKGDRVVGLKAELGDSFCLLDWKEIENYIPHNILIKTAQARWETFNQREGCNIYNFMNIDEAQFESKEDGIGRILEEHVDKQEGCTRKFYSADSGTIKDKVKFCHAAIKIMTDESDEWSLTPELKKLCKQLWDHVVEHN